MRLVYWEIDYQADLMRFTNVIDSLRIDSTANVLSFYTKATGTPIIPELFIDSVAIKNVTFDTGSAGILGISKRHREDFFAIGFDGEEITVVLLRRLRQTFL